MGFPIAKNGMKPPKGAPPISGPATGAATPPPVPAIQMNLAQMSAMGTTAGASAAQVSKGPAAGTGLPGAGPAEQPPGQSQAPVPPPPTPPIGATSRPSVGPHKGRSVGTHPSKSPHKRGNPVHGA